MPMSRKAGFGERDTMREYDVEVLPVMGLLGEPVVAKAIHKRMVATPPVDAEQDTLI